MVELSTLDIILFVVYIVFLSGIGLWLSFSKKQKKVDDYFIAGKSLVWWAVGGSLIASNISAEQFIGMSGSGYAIGLAIAAYEWLAAVTLIIVGKYFLPIFLKTGIYTMPQFLEQRYDKRTRVAMSVFWVFLFVFVNITSVLYLGGLAVSEFLGIKLIYSIIGLALFAATFSIFGGLKAVVWTDVIQVVMLLLGGIMASVLVLKEIGGGVWSGLVKMYHSAPEHFQMIIPKSSPQYKNLPGVWVLFTGMWIANLYYWGMNQYIIQRALAAKSIKQAQWGTAFAGFLKLLTPFVVVIPGIAAYVLHAHLVKPDDAYPWVLKHYIYKGFRGLVLAALISAIGSSLSSMVNSASTIFTLDIYKEYFLPKRLTGMARERRLVVVGKVSAALALIIGVLVAPLLSNLQQAFQYIQEYTGFISPGVVVVFLFGLFWKKASANGAFWTVLLSIPFSAFIKFAFPQVPFLNRMFIVFIILSMIFVLISLHENARKDDPKALYFDKSIFKTDWIFNISSVLIVLIVMLIYVFLW